MSISRERPRERVAEHHRTGRGVVRIGYPIGVRRLQLLRRTEVTPHMVRLTVGGSELAGFHSYQADDHVAIVFPDPDGTRRDPVPRPDQMLDWPHPSPRTRKYTVRRHDAEALELDLDVVLHEGGLASGWAAEVAVGDEVTVAGPPGAKAFPHHHDHYVLAVDTTALPAVARWLDESPYDVSAQLFVDHDHPDERGYPLAARDGVSVEWLLREGSTSRLATVVEERARRTPGTFLFAAGEAGDVKPLRRWSESRQDCLVTGYWKRGVAGLDA